MAICSRAGVDAGNLPDCSIVAGGRTGVVSKMSISRRSPLFWIVSLNAVRLPLAMATGSAKRPAHGRRQKRLDASRRNSLAGFLRALPIALDQETAYQAWKAPIRLAGRYRLSVYDGTYLEFAQRPKLPLATLDQDLIEPRRQQA